MKIFKDLEDLFWKNTLQEHEVKNAVNKFYLESTKLLVPFDMLSPRFKISDVLKEKLNTPKSDFVAAKFGRHNLSKNTYGGFSYLKSFEIWKSILNHKDTSLANFFQQTASEYNQSIEDKNLFIRKKEKLFSKLSMKAGLIETNFKNKQAILKLEQKFMNYFLMKYSLIFNSPFF